MPQNRRLLILSKQEQERLLFEGERKMKEQLTKTQYAKTVVDYNVYTEAAKRSVADYDNIEVDESPEISIADGGAWVQAWIWVSEDEI